MGWWSLFVRAGFMGVILMIGGAGVLFLMLREIIRSKRARKIIFFAMAILLFVLVLLFGPRWNPM
jgi:hypothetical protein